MADVDVQVAEIASDLRAAHGLRTPDAIHLATALDRRTDAFVTEDSRHFPKEVEGVPVLSLRETIARFGELTPEIANGADEPEG